MELRFIIMHLIGLSAALSVPQPSFVIPPVSKGLTSSVTDGILNQRVGAVSYVKHVDHNLSNHKNSIIDGPDYLLSSQLGPEEIQKTFSSHEVAKGVPGKYSRNFSYMNIYPSNYGQNIFSQSKQIRSQEERTKASSSAEVDSSKNQKQQSEEELEEEVDS